MRRNHSQISESLLIGALLAIVGGFLESYTFVTRGGVFANCQTGNLVMMVIKIADGAFYNAFLYLVPIVAFIVGVLITQKVRDLFSFHPNVHWRQVMIVFEILCLIVAMTVPIGKWDILVITLISFVSSLQTDSFRKIDGSLYATTMCTGNLRSGSEQLYNFISTKDKVAGIKSLKYFVIVFAFLFGAFVGVFLTKIFMTIAALFCCGLLLIIFFILFIHTKEEKRAMDKIARSKRIKKLSNKSEK